MYAIIEAGGKQYRIKEGEKLRVEKLSAKPGDIVELNKVLTIGEGDNIRIGMPYLTGAKVTATVNSNGRSNKIKIIKFHRRKHYRRQMGHRQPYTEIKINDIIA